MTQIRQRKGRSHSIISELFTTVQNTGIGINGEKNTETITIWTDEENNMVYYKKGERGKQLAKYFKADIIEIY
jgi:hypothetical protein